MENATIMQVFNPWEQYPSLELARLQQVATAIRTARNSVVPLHDPEAGDNNWSMHCRGYVRQCHAIRALSKTVPWLIVSSESPNDLEFSFCIGSVPLKIVRGEPDDPIHRHQNFGIGEQILMDTIMGELPARPLRIVAATDLQGNVVGVFLVEFEGRDPFRSYQIPLDDTEVFVIPTPDPVAPTPVESHDQSSDQQGSASA